jgi:hypothetical protein
MQRMRRLFASAAIVSALIAILLAVFWIRSRWVIDGVYRYGSERRLSLRSGNGTLRFTRQPPFSAGPIGWQWRAEPMPANVQIPWIFPWYERAGFVWNNEIPRGPSPSRRYVALEVPYWFLIVVSSLPSLGWSALWMRRRYARRGGGCTHCGYDLRATPELCPECGAAAFPSSHNHPLQQTGPGH